jgi:hypothetical protein
MLGRSVHNDPARCRPAHAAVLDGNPSFRGDADADPLLSILSIPFSSGSGRNYDDCRGELERRGATQRSTFTFALARLPSAPHSHILENLLDYAVVFHSNTHCFCPNSVN